MVVNLIDSHVYFHCARHFVFGIYSDCTRVLKTCILKIPRRMIYESNPSLQTVNRF